MLGHIVCRREGVGREGTRVRRDGVRGWTCLGMGRDFDEEKMKKWMKERCDCVEEGTHSELSPLSGKSN